MKLRPTAGRAEEAEESGALGPGKPWVTHPCEGNINKVHGVAEFCTSATLVRNNKPVVAAVHVPLAGLTYAAVTGAGSTENGRPIRVSEKTSLSGAFIASCQNGPDESRSAPVNLGNAAMKLLMRNAILRVAPSLTLQLLSVACGRVDCFFLFGAERAGLLAGALLAFEAGGVVTDVRGRPWTLASEDIVVAAREMHSELLVLLSEHGEHDQASM